jgi:hypothetical protein
VHSSRVEGDCFYGWVSVCVFCLVLRVALSGVVLFLVLLWHVGCESSRFGSIFYIALMWFVCIWMCSWVGFSVA